MKDTILVGTFIITILVIVIVLYYIDEIKIDILITRIVKSMIKNNYSPTSFKIKVRYVPIVREILSEMNYRIIKEEKENRGKILIKVFYLPSQ